MPTKVDRFSSLFHVYIIYIMAIHRYFLSKNMMFATGIGIVCFIDLYFISPCVRRAYFWIRRVDLFARQLRLPAAVACVCH